MQEVKEQTKQVGEKGEENLILMREVELVLEDRERETSATMPMSESEISEAELEEETGNALAISERDEGQGHAAERVEENQDASTDPVIGKKRKRQTADLKVQESQEGTCEPSEMIEQKAIHETAEKETKDIGEKGEENLILMRDVELVLEDRERETSATMPMSESEISEAELEEETGNALAISERDEGQGHAAERVEENQDASTDPVIGKKRKRQAADLKVQESQEGTCEPSEMIEQKAIHETAEKETKDIGEKGEENLILMRDVELVLEDRERETSATMPMSESEISEAELEEETDNALAISERDEGQGHAAERVEEYHDASTDHHMGKKMKRQTADLKVHESQEGTFEPSNMIEQKATHETAEEEAKEENNLDVGDDKNAFTTSKKSTENKEYPIACLLCDLQFETKYYQRKHMRTIHEEYRQQYKCSTCGKIFEQKGLYITHVETHKDKTERQKYYCKICDKTYLSKYYYDYHMERHNDKSKLIECKTCGKTLTSKQSLERHINDVHIKQIKYICDLCGKRLYTNSEIKFHLESHNIESAFKCEECGKGFLLDNQLKIHKKRVHSSAGHCRCEVCGSAFKSQANLKQHNLTVHSEVYKYHCDVCGKKFKRTSHQVAHMKIHSKDPANKRFKCELCSKAFQTRGMFKVHMDWHHNIRSNKCDVCGKSFLTKGNLDKHEYVHRDKKPHECQICSQGFIDLPVLRKHLDVKHNITLKKLVTQRVREANDSN
ncbi:zinc finger protein 37-like [Strongylocentrotus purpuratus]|uniref:C2H2-type domain-containing protein n=1 Tax=Strongylocentrotus purpuratus TaxID=7668 RepID=A0A7M7NUB3_STRPU|nr:zinc finger protein 37-like [Strongylocentrotus purpuratus]